MSYSRLKASDIFVLSAHRIPSGHCNPSLAVATAVHMHPEHILLGFVIVNNLRSFYHPVGPEVARAGSGQERANKRPLDEIRRGVAVDVRKRLAAALVLAYHIVRAVHLNETRAVSLQVFTVWLDSR